MRGKTNGTPDGRVPNYLLLLIGLLGGTLAVLFFRSFLPHQILFANDGPLGSMVAECNRLPGRFFGTWRNNSWVGAEAPTAAPTITAFLITMLQPAMWLKIYAPFTLFLVGFSAWVFFRTLEFSPMVCVLGGVAAGLNMHFFSTACWGLGSWNVAAAMTFLALAALCTKTIRPMWARAVLAGLAVGMNVMEGYDVGAILSIYVGVFVLFKAFSEEAGPARKAIAAVVTEALVVVFAGIIAAHTIHSLVGTQVEQVVGVQEDTDTKEKRWDPATQWSLPKMETVRLFTPGIFGYRLAQNITTTDKSAAYWGLVGQDPRIPQLKSDDPAVREKVIERISEVTPLYSEEAKGMASTDRDARLAAAEGIVQRLGYIARHSGTGEYAGVMVGLMAIFALVNSCRGSSSPYRAFERRAVWFWTAAALFSVLAAWGRFGFIYSLLYRFPYFQTIRNPIKFLHPFHIIWIILAAYGLEALHRRYLQGSVKQSAGLAENFSRWWPRAPGFEKKWLLACGLVVIASAVGVGVLFASQNRLADYIVKAGFAQSVVLGMAGFANLECAWFVGFLVASVAVVGLIMAGTWGGPKGNAPWYILGAILVLDLARSDVPWVHYYDYEEKYAPNCVTDFLSEKKPWDQRIMGRLSPRRAGSSNGRGAFGQLYNFWMQNDFPYRGFQCLDFAEMPRMPALDDAYMHNFELHGDDIWKADLRPAARLWELTGTRYLLLDAGGVGLLNNHGDPTQQGFHIVQRLQLQKKSNAGQLEDAGDLTMVPNPNGEQAIIEYGHVLPRAMLFAHWETPSNDQATLATLLAPEFVPQQTVLLATNTPLAQATGLTRTDPGTVEITDYHPKYIKLDAQAKAPAVLLLNERYHPSWTVKVDGQPATMLRCNFIMRGVFLPAGAHMVEFRYHTSLKYLCVSLAGWVAGILLAGYLVYSVRRETPKPVPLEAKPAKR